MPFSGVSRPAYSTRTWPGTGSGRGMRAKTGSANGWTTSMVGGSTSRKSAHSRAANRLVAIRVRSRVAAATTARSRARSGGGTCRIWYADASSGTTGASLTNTTGSGSSAMSAVDGSARKGMPSNSSRPSCSPSPTVTTCAGTPRRLSSRTWPIV